MEIELSPSALARLTRPVVGEGGFQRLLRKLQPQINGTTLTLDPVDQERLARYSCSYGDGGFQERTEEPASELQQTLDFLS